MSFVLYFVNIKSRTKQDKRQGSKMVKPKRTE